MSLHTFTCNLLCCCFSFKKNCFFTYQFQDCLSFESAWLIAKKRLILGLLLIGGITDFFNIILSEHHVELDPTCKIGVYKVQAMLKISSNEDSKECASKCQLLVIDFISEIYFCIFGINTFFWMQMQVVNLQDSNLSY